MQKEKFEKLVNETIRDADYELIMMVYTFYPGFDTSTGEKKIVDLYNAFGIRIFEDMSERAEVMNRYLSLIDSHNDEINLIKNKIENL